MPKPVDLSEFLPTPEPCPVGKALLTLSDEDQAKFTAALAKPREEIRDAWILKPFRARGVSMNKDTVARHRKGECRCG